MFSTFFRDGKQNIHNLCNNYGEFLDNVQVSMFWCSIVELHSCLAYGTFTHQYWHALCLMLTINGVPAVVSSHHMSLPQITELGKCHSIELFLIVSGFIMVQLVQPICIYKLTPAGCELGSLDPQAYILPIEPSLRAPSNFQLVLFSVSSLTMICEC